jgi:predicted nucleic acid-binding protein
VPALWQLEVANVLTLLRRRKVLTADEVQEGIGYLHDFAATVAEIDGNFLTVRDAFRVCLEANLTAYDSVYFELAQRENLPIATLDKALRETATRAGISTL